ncbi:MAG TPA: hypothetical protein VNM90_12350 [Haliangium sp.]|nr:hypothetical protein [Haliangium sp.]
MARLDPTLERIFSGIAHALFMNRLHLLRLTEIVRLRIQPNKEDGNMIVPPELDDELKQQAVDYVLTCFPEEFTEVIHRAKADWLRPA